MSVFTSKVQNALKSAVPALRTYAGQRLDVLLSNYALLLPGTPAFTVGTEGSNSISVSVQLKDQQGNNLAAKRRVTYWISDTAGGIPTGTVPDGTTGVTTGTILKVDTTKVLGRIVTNSSGVFVIAIGESTAKSFYLNVEVGDVVTSQVVTFA